MTLGEMVAQYRAQNQQPVQQPVQQQQPTPQAPTQYNPQALADLLRNSGFQFPGMISGFGGGTFNMDGSQVTPYAPPYGGNNWV